jgi:hypothetical protein
MLRYALIALTAIAVSATADMYKWVDESGEIHYSDQPPPPNAKLKEHVKAPPPAQPGSNATPAAAPNSTAEQDMAFRKRQAERDKAEAAQQAKLEDAETARRNCEQARNNLAGLQARSHATKYGPNGEIVYLTDEEIASAIVEAQTVMNSWCK